MSSFTPASLSHILAVSAFVATCANSTHAASTYVALGDSITFGETELQYIPSNGDRGYVNDFADVLAQRTGSRPTVRNFAIDGETAASFTSGTGRLPPVDGRTDATLAAQNVNYAGNTSITPARQFQTAVTAAVGAGRPVQTVSISLGFNDLASTVSDGQSPATALAAYRAQYSNILDTVRTTLPSADLYVLNYFNPFPAERRVHQRCVPRRRPARQRPPE